MRIASLVKRVLPSTWVWIYTFWCWLLKHLCCHPLGVFPYLRRTNRLRSDKAISFGTSLLRDKWQVRWFLRSFLTPTTISDSLVLILLGWGDVACRLLWSEYLLAIKLDHVLLYCISRQLIFLYNALNTWKRSHGFLKLNIITIVVNSSPVVDFSRPLQRSLWRWF